MSLFSGAGGAALALRRSGHKILGCFDFDKDAVETLKANGLPGVRADVSKIDWSPFTDEPVDLLEGGPPCQPFSSAANGVGERDARDCIPHFLDALDAIRPRAFVMENVRGLTFKKHAHYFSELLDRATSLGYTVDWRVLNAADFGVPQTRQRLFVVGRTDGDVVWPNATHAKGGAEGLRPWVSMAEALRLSPSDVRAMTVGDVEPDWVWERPATTIVGSFNPHVVAGPGYRKAGGPSRQNAPGSLRVTVEQAALLQGFPPCWRFVGGKTSVRKQIGNACPPALMAAAHAAVDVARRVGTLGG